MTQIAFAEDLRVRRTHKMIREAFFSLVQEKGFDAVTIQAIVDRAMVNRATFYRHYQDKYDLANRCVDFAVDDLQSQTGLLVDIQSVTAQELVHLSKVLFEKIAEKADLYRALLSERGLIRFHQELESHLAQSMQQRLSQMKYDRGNAKMPVEVAVQFMAVATLGVIQWWLEQDLRYPSDKMAIWLANLVINGPYSALGIPIDPFRGI